MNLTQLETELVWLTRKVSQDKTLIDALQEYFDNHQHRWSRGVLEYFFEEMEKIKNQHFYDEHRLEKLAWQVVMERDAQGLPTPPDR